MLKNSHPIVRLKAAQRKYVTDSHLNKVSSDRVMQNLCPYCTYSPVCTADSSDGTERVCLAKSSESHRTWIRVTPTRNKVEIGETYGPNIVLSMNHKDTNGYIYWNCMRGEVEVVVRGDNLLRITNTGRKYNVGSARNPDGTLHKYPAESHSKFGCALEKTVTNTIINDDGDHIIHRYETRVLCECGAAMRYDEYGDGLCEACTGLSRRNKKPCLDPEVKAIHAYKGFGVLEVRSINGDTSVRVKEVKKTADGLIEESAAIVQSFKDWCETF